MRLALFLVAYGCLLAGARSEYKKNLSFDHTQSVKHEQSGAEFHMERRGKLVDVVDLDYYYNGYDTITDIQCVRKGIRVFMDSKFRAEPQQAMGGHYDITEIWRPGMIVRSSLSWNGCQSQVDGETVDGIYRSITAILHGMDHLFLMTSEAGFEDNFEHLHYVMRHKRGNWEGIADEEKHQHRERVRRSVMTDDDLISALTHKKSTMTSKFDPEAHLFMATNYNTQYQMFDYHLLYDSDHGVAMFKNTDFLTIGQTPYSPRNQQNWWDVYCKECYSKINSDIRIFLTIQKRKIDTFTVEIDSDVEMIKKFEVHTKGTRSSKITNQLLTHSHFVASVPMLTLNRDLDKHIDMDIGFDLRQYIDIGLQFENVDSWFSFEAYERGNLSVVFRREATGNMSMEHTYTPVTSTVAEPQWEFTAVLDAASVEISNEMEFGLSVNWAEGERATDDGTTYRFKLHTNQLYSVALQQQFDFPTTQDSGGFGTVCFHPTHDLMLRAYVERTELQYRILGKKFWDGELNSNATFNGTIRSPTDFSSCPSPNSTVGCCVARVTGPVEKNADKSPEAACGAITTRIMRSGNDVFTKLIQVKSYSILFKNEEHTLEWCGSVNYPCADCRRDIAGYTKPALCADRMMSLDMSVSIKALAELVKRKYPSRRLIVINAWDEPTQDNPISGTSFGKFDYDSLHKEGRAVQVAISRELTADEMNYVFNEVPEADIDPAIMRMLGQLCVTADFDYVKIHNDHVHVGVVKGSWETGTTAANTHFNELMNSTYAAGVKMTECLRFESLVPNIKPLFRVSGARPSGLTMNQACGAIGIPITRYHKKQFAGFYYYPYNDVEFRNPTRDKEWCGMPGRACVDCRVNNESVVPPENRCRDRIMTHRLAFRLRRLAKFVEEKWGDSRRLIVEMAYDEPSKDSAYSWGTWKVKTSHHRVAQGLWLNVTGSNWESHLPELGRLAQCAGFDYVEYPPIPKPQVIWVCVKRENKPRSFVDTYQGPAQLQTSRPGWFAKNGKYAYPGKCSSTTIWCNGSDPLKEPYLSWFYDSTVYPSTVLVPDAKLKLVDFKDPAERFVRIDHTLVDCVGLVITKGKLNVEIKAAFRNQPDNEANRNEKHNEEKVRHQSGHAVILAMKTGTTGDKEIVQIGKAVIKLCGGKVNPQQRMLGIGVHKDELYFDIRPKPWEDPASIQVKFWEHDEGKPEVVEELKAWLKVIQGGPPIATLNVDFMCDFSRLGDENYFYNFKTTAGFFTSQRCNSTAPPPTPACSKTKTHRFAALKKVQGQLKKAAQFSPSTHTDVKKSLDDCMVMACTDCTVGPIHARKVLGCMAVLAFYKEKAGSPFKGLDKLAIYNMFSDTAIYSSSHIACDKQKFTCLEHTELFGMFETVLSRRYSPDNNENNQKLVYGDDNPSPLFEIIAQFVARYATKTVSVFLDHYRDVGLFKKLIKVLLTYNTNVEAVMVYVAPTIKVSTMQEIEDSGGEWLDHFYQTSMKDVNGTLYSYKVNAIMSSIINSADVWAGTVCPAKARPALAPLKLGSFAEIAGERPMVVTQKKKIDEGVKRRLRVVNWELDKQAKEGGD